MVRLAWLNSQRKISQKYSAIFCNYYGGQTKKIAKVINGVL
ncbi:MAG: hypothetical protein NZL96_03440 [Patescibacteria group bacterium]|nr:hypothetical protein [Patescibacteria group bacterium]